MSVLFGTFSQLVLLDENLCGICHGSLSNQPQWYCDNPTGGHLYHEACMRSWVESRGNRSVTCPECRTAVSAADLVRLRAAPAAALAPAPAAAPAPALPPPADLREACYRGDLAAVNRFLAAGADVHAQDESALILAARYGGVAVVERLFAADPDVHHWDERALHIVEENGHGAAVARLRAGGAAGSAGTRMTQVSGRGMSSRRG